jgi:rubrerythrin
MEEVAIELVTYSEWLCPSCGNWIQGEGDLTVETEVTCPVCNSKFPVVE